MVEMAILVPLYLLILIGAIHLGDIASLGQRAEMADRYLAWQSPDELSVGPLKLRQTFFAGFRGEITEARYGRESFEMPDLVRRTGTAVSDSTILLLSQTAAGFMETTSEVEFMYHPIASEGRGWLAFSNARVRGAKHTVLVDTTPGTAVVAPLPR